MVHCMIAAGTAKCESLNIGQILPLLTNINFYCYKHMVMFEKKYTSHTIISLPIAYIVKIRWPESIICCVCHILRFGLLISNSSFNATAYLSIVPEHVHPFMVTIHPRFFQHDNVLLYVSSESGSSNIAVNKWLKMTQQILHRPPDLCQLNASKMRWNWELSVWMHSQQIRWSWKPV